MKFLLLFILQCLAYSVFHFLSAACSFAVDVSSITECLLTPDSFVSVESWNLEKIKNVVTKKTLIADCWDLKLPVDLAHLMLYMSVSNSVLITCIIALQWSLCWIFFPLSVISCQRLFVFWLSVCQCLWLYTKSLWTRYLTNCLWEFDHIYNLDAARDRDKLILRSKGSKVKVTVRPDMVRKPLWKFWRSCVEMSISSTTCLVKACWLTVCHQTPSSFMCASTCCFFSGT